ncbi:hypothetical protein CXB51_021177 [Gossypium anomalum]|uniref:LOB domain-containing protein n=1 Tax=Gossypium anomalum TaxID=47600 RepID=A0A8J5YHE9_9ROSI|nr:hypothetical protein CXB51_021177 [Gossypium anomalum]
MTGCGSPCGACKFLRRKCFRGDRSEAALTISYEAQARLHDPIYGCVSHIFALQKQVVNLQAQLASLKAQAAQSIANGSVTANPNDKYHGKLHNLQDVQTWFHPNDSSMAPNLNPNLSTSSYGLSDRTSSLGNSRIQSSHQDQTIMSHLIQFLRMLLVPCLPLTCKRTTDNGQISRMWTTFKQWP